VYGFGRSQAQKAVQVAKKEVDKYNCIRYNKNGTVIVTDDWKEKGKISIPQKYKPNAVIETATMYKDGKTQIDRTIYNGAHHHSYTWIDKERKEKSIVIYYDG
jgi:hypothetical protein